MTLEVCCGNLESVHAAVTGGAPRIELCSALEVDGLTPSWDMLQEVRKLYPSLVVHVIMSVSIILFLLSIMSPILRGY